MGFMNCSSVELNRHKLVIPDIKVGAKLPKGKGKLSISGMSLRGVPALPELGFGL